MPRILSTIPPPNHSIFGTDEDFFGLRRTVPTHWRRCPYTKISLIFAGYRADTQRSSPGAKRSGLASVPSRRRFLPSSLCLSTSSLFRSVLFTQALQSTLAARTKMRAASRNHDAANDRPALAARPAGLPVDAVQVLKAAARSV